MAEERFQVRTGMNVVDRDGNRVGNVESILSEDRTGVSRFLVVDKRILPMEAIQGVEGDRVKVGVPQDTFRRLPERREGQIPGEEEQRRAYDVVGVRAPWD